MDKKQLGAWKADFLASWVVFLVALPLSIGIALACGVPEERAAMVGLLTAVISGIITAVLGGSPLQVSAPAAGLIVIVLPNGDTCFLNPQKAYGFAFNNLSSISPSP